MKKLILVFFLLPLWANSQSNPDRIILAEGDSIKCTIQKIDESTLYYYFSKAADSSSKSMSLSQITSFLLSGKLFPGGKVNPATASAATVAQTDNGISQKSYDQLTREIELLRMDMDIQKRTISKAGLHLKRATNNMGGFIACSVLSGFLLYAGNYLYSIGNGGRVFSYAGLTVGVGGVVLWFMHLGQLGKAGNKLKEINR